MSWLGNLYVQFWYHTEFWLTPVNRRPYTFIFRDWIYTHIPAFIVLTSIWFIGVIVLAQWYAVLTSILGILSGMVLAHLVWGSAWIEHQQEYPQYVEE